MAISTNYNYSELLSLDKAVLVKRSRLNYLGSKSLDVNYNNITSATKEDCLEWIDANRLTLTDPHISFKTCEGVWKSVEVKYDEKNSVISQSFKIDSSLENTVTERGANGTTEKSYYWKVADPTIYNIPHFKSSGGTSPVLTDAYWDDRGDENDGKAVYYGDGDTHALWWDSGASLYKISAIADVGGSPTDYFSSANIAASTDNPTHGSYTGSGAFTGTVVVSEVEYLNETWTKTVNDNGDGTYDVVISKSEISSSLSGGGAVRMWGETGTQAAAGNYDIVVTGTTYDGTYEFDGGTGIARTWTHTGGVHQIFHGLHASSGHTTWQLQGYYFRLTDPGFADTLILSNGGWRKSTGASGTGAPEVTLELGKNPPEYQELVTVTVNSAEMAFVADGGVVADPTVGQLKTISNIPQENGKFKTTITTRTVNSQRIPAIPNTGLVQWASNGYAGYGGTIIAKSQTLQSLNEDLNMLKDDRLSWSNGFSVTINKYGLYDYTIISNKK